MTVGLLLAWPIALLFPHLYVREALKDPSVCFAWLNFLIGASYTYLLVESGNRLDAGNFAWSGQITSFVLFVTTAVFLVRQNSGALARLRPRQPATRCDRRFPVCLGVFGMHVISGAIWYGLFLAGRAS